MKIIYIIFIIVLTFSLTASAKNSGSMGIKPVISMSRKASDLEGRLKEKDRYHFLKFRFRDNFFSINIGNKLYKELSEEQVEGLVDNIADLYSRSFNVFKRIFGFIPQDYRFNVTFGKTKRGEPFNKIYLNSKTSNIFPDFLPYDKKKTAFTNEQKMIMLHEIGHSLFGIAIGTLRDPRYKSIEEGFVDYFSEKVTNTRFRRLMPSQRFVISRKQAENMDGISQLDIEESIWQDKFLEQGLNKDGYAGLTHHVFGKEFIMSFIEVFGEDKLSEFLFRLRQSEGTLFKGELGSNHIKDILTNLAFTDEEVNNFKESLHRRLKKRVFRISIE